MSKKNCILFKFLDKRAVEPSKNSIVSVTYDLTAVSVYKKISPKTTIYDTGLNITIPYGYHGEIVGKKSLIYYGYTINKTLVQSLESGQERILIGLTKIDEYLPELKLPFTQCEIILRKNNNFDIMPVENENFSEEMIRKKILSKL
jgi:hypothetical protein